MNPKRILYLLVIAVIILLSFQINPVKAATAAQNQVVIYLFWGDGCSHCAVAKPFLQDLAAKNPGVELRAYEVWYNEDNYQLFQKMAEKFGFEPTAVPTIFIGDKYWVGYTDSISSQIMNKAEQCLVNSCPDAGEGIIEGAAVGTNGSKPTPGNDPAVIPDEHQLKIPLIGTVDLDKQSLLLSTLLISLVDGFNPCSLWVLSMLMALTLHTGSRRKILIIGLVFITITALIYALFIAGLFSVLSFMSYLGWVQALVAVITLIFALINIKDYFWYKEGVSLTISDKNKAGIYQRIRNVVTSSNSLAAMVAATVVLAAGVSLVEFSCTAGFPVLWTNILSAQGVDPLTFGTLLLVYMLVYQLDELVIFFSVVFTLKASRLEEKHGRILKLIGGTLMFVLAIIMLINPALMNDLTNSLLIFAGAIGLALLVLLLHRRVLPAMGIYIGSEKKKSQKTHRKHRK